MNKKELDLLEKAFSAEVRSAFRDRGDSIIFTKSKVADHLVQSGLLRRVGSWHFEITPEGHRVYCLAAAKELGRD